MIKRWLLERKWAREREENILRLGSSLAEKIISRRGKLYSEFLEKEKRKQDTRELKVRLEELDWIIGGLK